VTSGATGPTPSWVPA